MKVALQTLILSNPDLESSMEISKSKGSTIVKTIAVHIDPAGTS